MRYPDKKDEVTPVWRLCLLTLEEGQLGQQEGGQGGACNYYGGGGGRRSISGRQEEREDNAGEEEEDALKQDKTETGTKRRLNVYMG